MKQALGSNELGTGAKILMVAARLFAEVGFKKTTVSDIAGELRMSPANVYRFFTSKADIDQAVGRHLLREMETAGDGIVKGPGSAPDKLRAFLVSIEKANNDRFQSNRKLHDLLEVAFSENWLIARNHIDSITKSLCAIISEGHRTGEFAVSDCELAAALVRNASDRFWHPRVLAERFSDPEPTLDDMVDFCIAALAQKPAVTTRYAGSGIRPAA